MAPNGNGGGYRPIRRTEEGRGRGAAVVIYWRDIRSWLSLARSLACWGGDSSQTLYRERVGLDCARPIINTWAPIAGSSPFPQA